MAETLPAPFVMHGARDAIAGGLEHIEEQVRGIEQAVVENPGLAFDLAKSLVESVCRTVLDDRAIAFRDADDLPKLFKLASNYLSFLPTEASDSAEIRKSLKQTLGGLHTAIQGICELRNQCGFASHGSAKPRPEDNPAFNESVDETHGMIRIFEGEFRPSEVLFQMEPQSYRVYLTEFDTGAQGVEDDIVLGTPEEVTDD